MGNPVVTNADAVSFVDTYPLKKEQNNASDDPSVTHHRLSEAVTAI